MLKSSYILLLIIITFIYNIETITDYEKLTATDNFLNIPKINLNKKIYEIGNTLNKVDKNIELILDDTNNFILVGHNGNASISYFKDLEKLSIGDLIYFNYKGKLYIYRLSKIYEITKNGYFKKEKYEVSVINLITCKTNSDTLQIVYVGFLIE